jgi:hypothetical protein
MPALADTASGSRSNHSMAFSAAAWMLTFSIRAMKSRTFPPRLHSEKQFQTFLLMLTRNCVGLLPLWMGQGPLKLFEAAGVARTERSIVNWCQPNRHGISRLDSYFDPNERKYFLTPQSVGRVIQEEIQRTKKQPEQTVSASFGKVPNDAAKPQKQAVVSEDDTERVKELERENLDLKIANRGKDFLIEQMQKERKGFFDQLLTANRKMGELETRLLQLEYSRPAG